VIEGMRKHFPQIPLSIDTYKSQTAAAAIQAGAHIINDVWCLQYDGLMAEVAARFGCPLIISHNREQANYQNVVKEVVADLQRSVDQALKAGVKSENIWLDPGIGFAKNYEQNLIV